MRNLVFYFCASTILAFVMSCSDNGTNLVEDNISSSSIVSSVVDSIVVDLDLSGYPGNISMDDNVGDNYEDEGVYSSLPSVDGTIDGETTTSGTTTSGTTTSGTTTSGSVDPSIGGAVTTSGITTSGITTSGTVIENPNDDFDAGVITAGEWHDLSNWSFWITTITENYEQKDNYWGFYTDNRISVSVKTEDNEPVIDSEVALCNGKKVVWSSKTNNVGTAELWLSVYSEQGETDLSKYKLYVDGKLVTTTLTYYSDGVNNVVVDGSVSDLDNVEIAFIVDATGSMGDELNFLKEDLIDVISKSTVQSNMNILTGSVFYRDEGDEYVTINSPFSTDINITSSFIDAQFASGGGDFPEAVHSALYEAIYNLQWSDNARSRIAFLLLDAPPHYNQDVVNSLRTTIAKASQKGIRIVPIVASGIDKETEFLMRFFAIATNGTYVFITDDSGVGSSHLVASVGDYEVESLNDLLVRLIVEYSE